MRIQATIVVVVLLAGCCFPQNTTTSKLTPQYKTNRSDVDLRQRKRVLLIWRERAQSLTDEAIDDGWRVPHLRPILSVRLADAWWEIDPARARRWLDEGIEEVLHSSPKEPPEVRNQRLQAAQIVFQIADQHDRTAANKILDMLIDASNEHPAESRSHSSSEIANTLFHAAMDAANNNDVQRVEQLGDHILQLRDPGGMLSNVVFTLSLKNPAAAESYFLNALQTAASTSDYYSAWDLVQWLIPADGNVPAPSQNTKQQAINLAGAMLTQVPQDDQQTSQYCQGAPLLAERVLSLLPAAQQGLTQAALQSCQSSGTHTAAGSGADKCETADDCLARASRAASPEASASWKIHAARRAQHEKAPSRAVDILLSFTPEEKDADPAWDSDYLNVCVEALQQLYRLRDNNKVQEMLDRSPDEVRPGVILHFASVLAVSKDLPYATSMLVGARASLEKHPVQNPIAYIELLNLYTRIMPDDAPQALAFAVAGLNQITYPDLDEERAKGKKKLFRWSKPGERLEPVPVNGALMDNNEAYMAAALNGLDDPETRIAFKLTFLRYSLKKYRTAMKSIQIEVQAKSLPDNEITVDKSPYH